MKKHCLPVLAVLVTTSLLAAEDEKSKQADQDRIQGTWHVVTLEAGGIKAPGVIKGTRFLIKGDRFSSTGKPEDLRKYRLDPVAKPKTMDIPGSVEGEFAKAIYEVTEDTLKLCFSQSTKLDRPKNFNTAGTRYFCFTLKRTTPEDDAK